VYQSIDDPENNGPDEGKTRLKLAWALWLLFGLVIIFAVIYLTNPMQPYTPIEDEDHSNLAKTAYHKAISEPNPALRRARLNDYLLSIENGPHENAVLAQIDVINEYDRRDWETLQDIIYNEDVEQSAKIEALYTYEAEWGGALLGARDEDIIRLRAEISGEIEDPDLPDRSFEGGPSPIPKNVPDGELAGGIRPTVTYVPPRRTFTRPVEPETPVVKEVETKPLRVRRNATPKYPRKAQRRNIAAIVTLALNIDDRGRVQMTEVISVEATRYADDFIKAAERAALRTRYHPKEINGEPVAVSGVRKRYRFEP